MIISSRTPEGEPGRCPVCHNFARVDPSTMPMRDAPCPHCGHLLLFGKTPARRRSLAYRAGVLVRKLVLWPVPRTITEW